MKAQIKILIAIVALSFAISLFLMLVLLVSGPPEASAATEIHTLRWTNPCANALVIDTTYFSCDGGPSLHDLDHVTIYGWPAAGGMAMALLRKDERGMECLPDSADVDTQGLGWHYWLIAADTAGNPSCPSNVIYLGPVTGIPAGDQIVADPQVRTRFFDVRGRLIQAPHASGIYWVKTWFRSGRTEQRKIVLVK